MTRKNGRIKQKLQLALIYLYPAAFFLITPAALIFRGSWALHTLLMEHLSLSIQLQSSAGSTVAQNPPIVTLPE